MKNPQKVFGDFFLSRRVEHEIYVFCVEVDVPVLADGLALQAAEIRFAPPVQRRSPVEIVDARPGP